MIGTNPINNHPKNTWKASVKYKKHTLKTRKDKGCRKFQQKGKLGEDEAMKKRTIGREEKSAENFSFSSLLIGLYKEKKKDKSKILIDQGGKLH